MILTETIETELGDLKCIKRVLTDRQMKFMAEMISVQILRPLKEYSDSDFFEDYVDLYSDWLLTISSVWNGEYDETSGMIEFKDEDLDRIFAHFQNCERHADLKRQERTVGIEQYLKDNLEELAQRAASDPKILLQLKLWAR